MPYKFHEVGEEPKRALLRRGDILRWLGIRPNTFDRIVEAGLLPYKEINPGGRFYKKSDVRYVFLDNYRVGIGKMKNG